MIAAAVDAPAAARLEVRAAAINGGYHLAFVLGAVCAAGAALIGWGVIRVRQGPPTEPECEFAAAE